VKLCYIHAYRHRFGVEPICAVLSEHGMTIAPQTYYRWLACPIRPAELEEAYLVNAIVDIYRRNRCVYGVRKMWHAARRAGLRVGRDQVGRLMRIAGIQGVRRGMHRTVTTTRDERAPRHPDLVKRGWAAPNRPDAVWVADFTYVWTAAGFCYVSFITDVYSRRILGWRVSMSKTTDLVAAALAQALATRRRSDSEFTARGLVHHSDAGSQLRLNRSLQHLDREVCCGARARLGRGSDGQAADAVAGSSAGRPQGTSAIVLGGDLTRGYKYGCRAGSRRVAGPRHAVVPRLWRGDTSVGFSCGLGPVPVVC
jgi:putative transposase